MTGSSILEYVHRLDQQELVQQFHLTPPTWMTSSPSHLYYSDEECADEDRTTLGSSLSNGLSSMLYHINTVCRDEYAVLCRNKCEIIAFY